MAIQPVTDRINLTYQNHEDKPIELPFRVLVIADLTADSRSLDITQVKPTRLDLDSDALLSAFNVNLAINIENLLNESGDVVEVDIGLYSVSDFEPASLLESIPELSDAFQVYQQLSNDKIKASNLIDSLSEYGFDVDDSLDYSDRLVIQQVMHDRINDQLNLVLQHPTFRKLESSWRSLAFLNEYIDGKENVDLVVANISKQALQEDFEDSPDVTQSALFNHIYTQEFGQFGGRPYSLVLGDYEFSNQAQDIALLTSMSKLCAMSHCPFISAASGKMFGVDSYSDFSRIRDIQSHFDQPAFAKWNSFRETDDSRYVCLTLPKFLLRAKHTMLGNGFEFNEHAVQNQVGLWGNSAYPLVTRFINSFKTFRWFINVTGDEYGLIDTIKIHESATKLGSLIPTEVLISDRTANELIASGFTPLVVRRRTGNAGFVSVPSCHAIAHDKSSHAELLNHQLETQIPYILISCRFSQYIKVMQRENMGSWLTRSQIDQSINRWLKQYVSDMDNPAPAVRARRPLRNAHVNVRDVEGKAGWFLSTITITPHFKFMGQSFTLTERAKLEKA
ncbi:type VI secretion system contractile sheath large subunit [Bermanella sp. R86510]|uniref:type VI secretion system contractile sheath large subunit n=1 Tax=unclassified Bermanella TaxID=2627862 RepID=UPI0037CC50DF